MDTSRWDALERLLRRRGLLSAPEIGAELGISQPTVSRLITQAGDRLIRIGRARASRYALTHDITRAGSHWPLYRISPDAQAQRIGELHAVHGDRFHFSATTDRPTFLHGEFASGLFPGLPWFLDDQRPQGFLGRAFARRVGNDIAAPDDIRMWRNDDIALALIRHGHDQPGDLVLGEASLQTALQAILNPPTPLLTSDRPEHYPRYAEAALRGDAVGSSVAGEQPKFALTLRDGDRYRPVIVKFSDRVDSEAGRRWADLLIAEHHAACVLQNNALAATDSEIIEADSRIFLEATRFDRTPVLGRRGLVPLAALDAAFYGHGRIEWWRFAAELQRDGWLSAADARRLRMYAWFGTLIANTDMHLGNASLHLTDERPLALAPCYDMLPMLFRPAVNGEVVARRYEVALPLPEYQDDWRSAAAMAEQFWLRVAQDARISDGFRAIATEAGLQLQRALAKFGN